VRPLEARREAFMRLVAGVNGIPFNEAHVAEGAVVFAKACELGLEGIVSKRAGSFYRSGRSRNWLDEEPRFRQDVTYGATAM
jgi:bifunctional non-homologous end joining protein LigD